MERVAKNLNFKGENIVFHENESNNNSQIQMFKDSLENSVNNVPISLNDSLNNNNILSNYTLEKHSNYITPQKYSIEECSTEEKTRFSHNIRELKKSYITKNNNLSTRDRENNYNTINSNTCNTNLLSVFNNADETIKIQYKFAPKTNAEGVNERVNSLSTYQEEILKNEEKLFWFAAYDKLMKRKNIDKILEFCDKEKNSCAYLKIVNFIFILTFIEREMCNFKRF
jgi:hypothetical protein